jgi:hypothetical protein
MSVFTCRDHDGIWPVGTASVIVADDYLQARKLLIAELKKRKLETDDFTLQELDLTYPHVLVLRDGDY